ncbi:HAD family hydrolase [Acidiferrimicrobium sp. IK]|uniref:HAD family hydrolase n=1 Tax=Acidiferrimicrobium sp. IK TaxID=2871700 RepID=UPI0021CB4884|nr:HAD family hydrolase [Acidiferrimicrobium sp. IK]MCU4184924.1 HAD family hydrolase [Acidiferrimicrobium sp. IK]
MTEEAPQLVILDCDGVLVDSEKLAVEIESEMLTAMGWPLSPLDVLERFVGRSDAYTLQQIEAGLGRRAPEWPARYAERLTAAFRAHLRPVPGVEAALDALRVPTCVASSGPHEKIRLTLGLTGLLERFDGRIFSATDVARGKPAPDLFLHAAAAMGADPSACVVVEDSRAGVEAARAAGMRSLGFAGGLTPREWLEGPGTTVFEDMADLPGLVTAPPPSGRPPAPRRAPLRQGEAG